MEAGGGSESAGAIGVGGRGGREATMKNEDTSSHYLPTYNCGSVKERAAAALPSAS